MQRVYVLLAPVSAVAFATDLPPNSPERRENRSVRREYRCVLTCPVRAGEFATKMAPMDGAPPRQEPQEYDR